jgi:hypothetical protein
MDEGQERNQDSAQLLSFGTDVLNDLQYNFSWREFLRVV